MARVTVEDCSEKINDKFQLVALVAQRAKAINSGSSIFVTNKKLEKATVTALREIAEGYITTQTLTDQLLRSLRTNNMVDPIDDDPLDSPLEEEIEGFDYLPNGADICVTEGYSDLDNQIFDDNFSDEEQKL